MYVFVLIIIAFYLIYDFLWSWIPATIISGERLKRYVFHKLSVEFPEGPFCIVYMHSTVHSEDNNPGMSILRWVYEDLPSDYKERLQVVYFLHPGLRSRLAVATLGRLFLSGRLVSVINLFLQRNYDLKYIIETVFFDSLLASTPEIKCLLIHFLAGMCLKILQIIWRSIYFIVL